MLPLLFFFWVFFCSCFLLGGGTFSSLAASFLRFTVQYTNISLCWKSTSVEVVCVGMGICTTTYQCMCGIYQQHWTLAAQFGVTVLLLQG